MIASYGDAIVDLFALPTGRGLDEATAFEPHLGGSTCNVAVAAARYGASVRFIGAVGPDAFGQRIRRELSAEGVDVSALVTLASTRTPVTFVTVDRDGGRSFLSYRQGGADSAMGPDSLTQTALDGVRWLHLATSSLRAEPRASATRALLSRAISAGVRVSVDLNVRPGLWSGRDGLLAAVRELCACASLVKASEEDLEALALTPSMASLEALCEGAVAVLTRAERGAVARVDAADVEVLAPEVAVVDSTGAGDAFVGALLARIAELPTLERTHARWREDLEVACRAGADAVTRVGATTGVRRARPR